MDYIAFNVIIDDIVFPDGRTCMGVLGGGGTQAAFGMRLWAEKVGLVAGVGSDLPVEALEWLSRSQIDTSGLRRSELPTPRAWQVMEEDGRRVQIWRVPDPAVEAQMSVQVEYLPESYHSALGFHYGVHPLEIPVDFLLGLRGYGGTLSIEPFKPAERRPTVKELAYLLEAGEIFSPNIEEAVSILGQAEPLDLLRGLLSRGAEIANLRMGAEGSLMGRKGSAEAIHIPAVEVPVIDPIGAGNACCGGFLVGWVEQHDLLEAGLYGAVSASFLVEQIGIPVPDAALRTEARRRAEVLRPRVEIINL